MEVAQDHVQWQIMILTFKLLGPPIFFRPFCFVRTWDSSVVQRWVTGSMFGSSSLGRGWKFLFTTTSRLPLGRTQTPIQWVTVSLSLGVKQPKREAEHSPASNAEVKNAWSYTSNT
jgi:hypothetical protein